jgi:UDP-3-O-[3-hydroxymyristoyl] glucosamine N-acyltransferase
VYAQVVIREEIQIGARCIIHPGAVIGADGYGFYFAQGKHNKIPQVGTVIIEDDVEIGASTTIDRATTGATRIGRGTKIDNLVHIAHNVVVGENTLLVAQVGIAGSCTLGKGVVMGGQSGVADHMTIGDGAQIGGQTGVIQDAEPGAVLFGTPAQPIKDAMKQAVLLKRLGDLFADVKKLKGKGK